MLSLINFVKIRSPDFFTKKKKIIKTYRLSQNYTFEILPFQRQCISEVNKLFFTGLSLFTSERKVNRGFRIYVHWFGIVVLTRIEVTSLIFINIKMFLNVNHKTLKVYYEKQLWWPFIYRVIVHSPVPLVLLHRSGVLSVYCWHGFCFEFLNKFDECMMEKST